jgi:penicillin amidase
VVDGDVHITGLSAPVIVRRDVHGVPHIDAATQQDLFVAQGYVTAQDRLWQIDMYRRNANGELAEVLGPSLVKHDTAQRVLGFGAAARRIYANLPADDRARWDAYARGVNLYIAQHQDSLQPEFKLLFYKPKQWTGADSVSIGMMMVDMLDTHWDVKLRRERIAAKLNNPQLEAELYPVGSWRDHPPTGELVDLTQPRPAPPPTGDDEEDDRTQTRLKPLRQHDQNDDDLLALRDTLGLPSCDGCAAGSNNWVVAGRHTATGKPLLSNDMHLPISVPNIWYIADLRAPGYHAAGVTLPGMPFVIAGHNEHVAWGFTAMFADVQDLYVEKLDGKGNFEGGDAQWHPLAVDHEVIHVRAGKDVTLDVQRTDHGPLLNPILPHEGRPISLKWTLYDSALHSIPLYAMNTASNWTEFSAALGQWCWPTQNVVYSDDQGHIAYHAVGKVPIRWGGHGVLGVPAPHDTFNFRYEWGLTPYSPDNIKYVPFDQLPNTVDPPSGFLATANSRVTTDKSPYQLTLEWMDPYRIERIYKALQGRDQLTPKDMLATQTDIYSEVDQELAHRLAYAIDHAAATDDRMRKAADLMRSWDGRLSADSPAASLVTQARRALWPLILEPKLGKDAAEYRWAESNFAQEEIIMHGITDWLPPGFKDWDAVLTEAVRKGMEKGKAPGDMGQWTYGSWHVIDIEHPLSSFLPLVGRVAGTGEQPLSGDTTTVKQVGRDFGPSQRFTMDWSNIDGSTENIVLGESGNPYSPWFRDQWKDWYSGTTFAFPFTPPAVAACTQHTLRLLP